MSNSIWKKPDQKPERNEDILVEYTSTNGLSYYIVDSYLNELLQPKRWAYLTDIIAQAGKAERLQKAVGLAVGALEEIAKREDNDVFFSNKTTAEEALKKIQQKD